MDDIYGIRRKNFLRLLEMPDLAKLNRELDRAVALDLSPSMYSQLKNPAYKMGDDMARRIEGQLGLEFAWMDQANEVSTGSQPERLTPAKVASVLQALTWFLQRRDPKAVIDLTILEDAELFAEVYSEYAPVSGTPEGQMMLGATVTDLLAKRERKHGRRTGGSDTAVGTDGTQVGEAVPGPEAATSGSDGEVATGRSRKGPARRRN